MFFKEVTFYRALKKGSISHFEMVFPSEIVEFNGGRGGNYHFADIFGKHHKFFRPYTHQTQDFKVSVLNNGYCFTDNEIVFTKKKEILFEHTSYRTHPLCLDKSPTNFVIRWARKRVIFYKRLIASIRLLFSKKINKNVVLLTRPDIQDCYGHLIVDIMAGYYQVKTFCQKNNIKIDYYILPTKLKFQRELISLLQINMSQVIPSESKIAIQAKNLIIPTLMSDYEVVDYRGFIKPNFNITPPFAKNLYTNLIPETKPFRKIYLKRPEKSNRNITNFQEVETIFKKFGYEIILPDILPLQEQINLFSQTKCIASMHGSGLNNMIFMQENTFVLEIFSEFYHDRVPQTIAFIKGINYSYMIGKTADTSVHPQQENVYINPTELTKALEIMDCKIEKNM
ncbi:MULTISPECIES: glycosyltransferase family 61 protein [unclassified Helicobacter]|uniref:glycosyltransferase family 61 protein n=1 Tax=unclassified Helicobacter TaxID=2593540 RepID=UPI000CF0952D|nr:MULTISPECIES: glycosyltransferase family 61 protein [unclassified Helicobacter]